MDIETVTIFRNWIELAAMLPTDEKRGKFYHAICEYSLYGKEPQLEGLLMTYFKLIQPVVDKSNKRKLAQQKSLQMRLQNKSQNDLQNKSQNDLQNSLQTNLQNRSKCDLQSIAPEHKKPVEKPLSFVDQLPEHLQTESFRAKWLEWEKYRRTARRKAISKEAFARQLKDLRTWTEEVAAAAIEYSITSDYQRLVAPKNQPAQRPNTPARKDYSGV